MIGIVCAGQIELSPFVKKYIKVFEQNNAEYEIIHWDRSGTKRNDSENYYTFDVRLNRYSSKFSKLIPFIKFSRYASRIITERRYSKLVILTSQTAILLLPMLLGKYKKRYFFDYRDTSYEYIKPYSMLINKIADNSIGMCVSSPGFKEYIKTSAPTVISHNFQDEHVSSRAIECKKKTDGKIVMGYIGVLREYEYIKKLISDFGNDKRFEFRIHGGGDDVERLRQYSLRFDNVYVAGAYDEKDKPRIMETFDMICYNYPTSFVNYPAVANKLYDGIIMKKPLFANSRTFSGKLVQTNGLGISIDQDDESITDKLYNYYSDMDVNVFSEKCEEFLEKVLEEEKEYLAAIKKMI